MLLEKITEELRSLAAGDVSKSSAYNCYLFIYYIKSYSKYNIKKFKKQHMKLKIKNDSTQHMTVYTNSSVLTIVAININV